MNKRIALALFLAADLSLSAAVALAWSPAAGLALSAVLLFFIGCGYFAAAEGQQPRQ